FPKDVARLGELTGAIEFLSPINKLLIFRRRRCHLTDAPFRRVLLETPSMMIDGQKSERTSPQSLRRASFPRQEGKTSSRKRCPLVDSVRPSLSLLWLPVEHHDEDDDRDWDGWQSRRGAPRD